MNRVEETRSLADEDGSIAAYLAVEDDFTSLGEFESFLKDRGLLGEAPTAAAPFKDLHTLAFRTALDFLLNRYRDIVRTGDLIESSSLVIAPAGRADYARILGLVGESNLKLDSVYEAERFLRKALEVEPGNLDFLLSLERCYGRVNEEAKAAEVRREIDRLTGPAAIDLGGRAVGKGESAAFDFVSDGRPGTLRLEFAPTAAGGRPLLSLFLNGKVVWENNGDTGLVSFGIGPRAGRNSLEIAAVSESIRLIGISFAE
jgi:tetratricopeptide (TPR) repeat protein